MKARVAWWVLWLLAAPPPVAAQDAPDAGPPDAGPGIEQLYTACPDAPPVVPVDGGYFTPDLRQRRENCRQAACEAFAVPKLAEEQGPAHPGVVLLTIGGGVVLLSVGVIVGYEVPHRP